MPPVVAVAIGQFRPLKGQYQRNLARVGEIMAQTTSLDPAPQVLHLPETVLSGYFVEGGVRELAVTAETLAEQLNEQFRSRVPEPATLDVVLGFYEIWSNNLHNSAMCVTLGGRIPEIRHVHRKVFLPTYGLFDEERFVERGHEIRAFDTSWGRAAILICEDAWHSLTGTIAALDGAQVIFLSAAAPARGIWPRGDDTPGPYTLNRWERLARDIAEEHGVFLSLAHLTGSEGGKIFAGGSVFVGPRGELLCRAPVFEEALVSVSADFEDITRARADMPLLSDLETVLPYIIGNVDTVRSGNPSSRPRPATGKAGADAMASGPPDTGGTTTRPASQASMGEMLNVVRANGAAAPATLDIDPFTATSMLVSFVRDEFERRGFTRAVVGLSGGVDSAVTAYLGAQALGAENVIGVLMPYRTSSAESSAHAHEVVKQLGIQSRTVDISGAVDGYLGEEPEATPERRGNVMSRVRMLTLFDLSAKHRALPLGTGNKSERLLGYFTWHADDSPPVNPIGDLYKTQVWALARHLGVPDSIVTKPATADLIQGQTDEADLGVGYKAADLVLTWLLAGYGLGDIIAHGLPEADVKKVAERLAATHWKRKLPTVAMLSATAIGESYLRPVDY
jgi:NAD+ synthetase